MSVQGSCQAVLVTFEPSSGPVVDRPQATSLSLSRNFDSVSPSIPLHPSPVPRAPALLVLAMPRESMSLVVFGATMYAIALLVGRLAALNAKVEAVHPLILLETVRVHSVRGGQRGVPNLCVPTSGFLTSVFHVSIVCLHIPCQYAAPQQSRRGNVGLGASGLTDGPPHYTVCAKTVLCTVPKRWPCLCTHGNALGRQRAAADTRPRAAASDLGHTCLTIPPSSTGTCPLTKTPAAPCCTSRSASPSSGWAKRIAAHTGRPKPASTRRRGWHHCSH